MFGPSRRYVCKSLVELPVLISRLDRKEDVLVIQTYLIDAEVPFLCGKQTLEYWKFKIDGVENILDIRVNTDQEYSKKFFLLMLKSGASSFHSFALVIKRASGLAKPVCGIVNFILYKEYCNVEEDPALPYACSVMSCHVLSCTNVKYCNLDEGPTFPHVYNVI